MSGVVSTNFELLVARGRLGACITLLEEGLRSLRRTPYHRLLGRDFLSQTEGAAAYITDFYSAASARGRVAALYFEMNGFAVNTGRWYCDGFAYGKVGDVWELDWLSSWDFETDSPFVLEGMGPVREAFAELYGRGGQPLGVQLAGELAEHLVTARFMQLIDAAHRVARRRDRRLRGLPVLSTAHDWDTAHRTA